MYLRSAAVCGWLPPIHRMHQPLTLNHVLATRGLNGKQLAHQLGTTESTVSRWRRGLEPSETMKARISEALDLAEAEVVALGWAEETSHA
jgi:transcriptional regulator with XRE-family HTH domain